MKQWTVDTCVLVKCGDTDDTDCIVCSVFLGQILRDGKLCLDHEGEIEGEYAPYIRANPWLVTWWYMITRQVGHLAFWSNKLSERHRRRLIEKLDFDDSDIKFVGVAARSVDKILVSGWDSDYTVAVCQYLKEKIGISVITPEFALRM